MTVHGEARYVAVTDPLPAGFEAIDAQLETTARDLAEAATGVGEESRDPWAWLWRGGFEHIEKHDDCLAAFATSLGPGRHELSYLVRATSSGTFTVAGARIEAMYAAELEGRSASTTAVITPR